MEASAAMGGAQASNGEAAESATDAQEQTTAPAAVDFSPVLEQIEQLRSDFQRPQEQQTEQAPEEAQGPDLDLSWLDAEQGVFDPEAMQQGFQQAVEAAAAKAQEGPMREILRMRQEQEFDRLGNEYPELTDESTFKGVVQATGQVISQIMSETGLTQDQARALSNSPAMLRLVYRGAKADEAAQGEQPADAAAAHVQGGSGPRPADQEEDPLAGVFSPQGGQNLFS